MADRVPARSLTQVPDHVLIAGLKQLLVDGRGNLVEVLLHLAEIDVRRLHLPARSKAEIQQLLAQRFPQEDVPTRVVPISIAPPAPSIEHKQAIVAAGETGQLMPASVGFIGVSAITAPLAPERFALHCTLHEQEMADLKRAQELLGRTFPSGDAARVIGRALRLLVERLGAPLRCEARSGTGS